MDHQEEPFRTHRTEPVVYQKAIAKPQAYYALAPDSSSINLEEPGGGKGLRAHWQILVRYYRRILLAGLAGAILGFLIGVPQKPVYRASSSLEVLNVNEDFMNMKVADPVVTGENSSDLSEEETQAALLESDPLLDRVYAKLDPSPTPPAQFAVTGWRSWLHLKEAVKPSLREQALNKALSTVKISNTPRTRILHLTVDSPDPQIAVEFANTLVDEFLKKNVEERWASTHVTSDWLNREINDARTQLRSSESALQAYARDSGLVFTDNTQTTNIATEKLQRLQQELSSAATDRITKQATFELAKNSPPDSLSAILNDPGLQGITARLDDVSRQLASLSAVYNSSYSKVKEEEAEVATLQSAFTRQRSNLLNRIETDYNDAVRREKLLAASYDSQAREVAGQDERAVQYNMLKRDVDSNRQLYDTMLQQMKQAAVATALRTSNVRVIDAAYLLGKPVSPNFRLNSMLGLAAGLFGSVLWSFVSEQTDRTLREPGDVRLYTELPELGAIPRVGKGKRRRKITRGAPRVLELDASDNRLFLTGRVENDSTELLEVWQKPGPLAESFRSVLASILLVEEKAAQARVLVMTSAEPTDGKTTMVSNIAIASAEIGRKVLMIDADLRCPRIHLMFGLSNEAGLSDLLSCADLDQVISGLIQSSGVKGLSVLTAGVCSNVAAQLFYSPTFAALIARLKKDYDLILIDTPPALQITDARVIGRLADAVVLVARAGKTTREALLAAKARFEEDHIRVLGTILNDWEPGRQRATYYAGALTAKSTNG